jgi:trk system potassium uptake protein TrkA
MKISDIVSKENFPDGTVIAGIFDKKRDRFIVPRGNREIFAGNQVFLVASKEDMEKAAKFLLNKQ